MGNEYRRHKDLCRDGLGPLKNASGRRYYSSGAKKSEQALMGEKEDAAGRELTERSPTA